MSCRQILALLGALVGLGATIGATVSNEWKTTSRASSVITATWVFQGLWMNCAGNAIGAVHCREHLTIFKRRELALNFCCGQPENKPRELNTCLERKQAKVTVIA